jgi:large subunit ribosomal protein L14
MIQTRTKVKIIDNTGAKIGRCIKVYNKHKGIGKIGDIIMVSVIETDKDAQKRGTSIKIKRGDIHKGVIVRTKKKSVVGTIQRSFDDNSIILIQRDTKTIAPIGNRVIEPISGELVDNKQRYEKILAIAPRII